jgi:hypothetical protein
MRTWVAVVVLLFVQPALADDKSGHFSIEGWYAKAGGFFGAAAARDRGTAPVLGAVATVVHLDEEARWFGLQADVGIDWNGKADAGPRYTLGPEAGWTIVGATAGFFGEHVEGDLRSGVFVGGKLTIGFLAAYIRYTDVTSKDSDAGAVEFGIQVKKLLFTDNK